jgi:hypothetical protein
LFIVEGFGLGNMGQRFKVYIQGLGFRVKGKGCRILGSGFRVQGLGFRV